MLSGLLISITVTFAALGTSCLESGCQEEERYHRLSTFQQTIVPYNTSDTITMIYQKPAYTDTVTFAGQNREVKFKRTSFTHDRGIRGCERITNHYRQIHYNFRSLDGASQFKVINNKEWDEILVRIDSLKVSFFTEQLRKPLSKDTVRFNGSAYTRYFHLHSFFYYSPNEGVLKLKRGNETWSILNYKH